MKTLVIAEKPSVAADLARVLKVPKSGDIYENATHVISSAVGHLVELQYPEDIDPALRAWKLSTLPIIPEKFSLKVAEKATARFQLLKKLLNRADIATAVNACDAGREGELIFAYIYQLAKAKVPVQRAWMQTMTTDGIRAAFDKLRPAAEMAGLEAAARCRSESDWLIGLNGTRALTKRLGGSKNVVTVGRVQTPTLAIVAGRDAEIRDFQPRQYHRVTATFQLSAGSYEGTYQRPDFKKNPTDEHDRADRLWHTPTAQAIADAARAASIAAVSDEKKAATSAPPRLYDLTTLQREANSRYGLPARRTLQIAQALYERHKVITYPRTDSRALPEDYIPTCKATLAKLSHADLATHANRALEAGYVRPNKRIFNNAQISDHFAIIPTGTSADKLDEYEAKIYDMIARRFVATFYPAAEYDVTTRTTTIQPAKPLQGQFTPPPPDAPVPLATLEFKTEGKVLTAPGWLAVYGKTATDADALSQPAGDDAAQGTKGDAAAKNTPLPPISKPDGQPPRARPADATLHTETTKPPPRYTEATLLSAMEGAGKLVDDEELADAMKERGLGTPATRAEIIEGLINQNYLERGTKRELLTTAKARSLLEFLGLLHADALTKPDMTAQWEYKLRQMEHGNHTRAEFMREIANATRALIEKVKTYSEDTHETTRETDIPSPTDGQPLLETPRTYKSKDGLLIIYKTIAGRRITEDEVRALVRDQEIGPLDDFTSPRTGKKFNAKLRLAFDPKKPEGRKVELDFGDRIDHATAVPFWTAPDKQTQLVEGPAGYVLRQVSGDGDYKELFKIGRTLCQKEITPTHAIQLAADGCTELIEGFVSKKGRPFNATLHRQGTRISWEFPPREPKADAKGGTDDATTDAKGARGAKTARGSKSATATHDIAAAEDLGPASLFPDGAHLFRTSTHYVVTTPPAATAAPQPRPYFQQASTLCGLELPPEQMQQLVNKGRTDLLQGMLSKAGRNFNAFLVLSKTKTKADFEFPPR